MAYATYQDYTELYKGNRIAGQEEFDRLAVRASAYLNYMTYRRAERYEDTEHKLALACCAVADCMQDAEQREGFIASEKVGDHSVSYRAGSLEADAAAFYAAARMYLIGTGLIYGGIPVVHAAHCHPC